MIICPEEYFGDFFYRRIAIDVSKRVSVSIITPSPDKIIDNRESNPVVPVLIVTDPASANFLMEKAAS